jgi:hypothetical protein
LGGSAPRLRSIELRGIPFPALPKLLLSTHDLDGLFLHDIPRSGYISPEAMVTGLSTLNRLKDLTIDFQSPRFLADREIRHPPPLTRIVLPALSYFCFTGDSEYLEDIVSRIDAPLLTSLGIVVFNQLVVHTPSLRGFISRTELVKTLRKAYIRFFSSANAVTFYQEDHSGWNLDLHILSNATDHRLSSLARLSSLSLPPLPTLKRLELEIYGDGQDLYEDMEPTQWLELLKPFTFVEDLVVSDELVEPVTLALQELAYENVMGLLPTLQNLFLTGLGLSMDTQEDVDQFIAARQDAGHPVNVHHRNGEGVEYTHWEVNDR